LILPSFRVLLSATQEIPQQVGSATNNLKLEETMRICCLLALAGLAISFALPTFAQQKDTADPRTVQQRDLLGVPKNSSGRPTIGFNTSWERRLSECDRQRSLGGRTMDEYFSKPDWF
jgi:hypothetical protein